MSNLKISDSALSALKEMWIDEHRTAMDQRAFPGAVGNAGNWLVKRGLAERLGLFTYASEKHGCRPWRYVRFKLTDLGRKLCEEMSLPIH